VPQEYPIYWGRDGVNGGKLAFYYAGRSAYDADGAGFPKFAENWQLPLNSRRCNDFITVHC
jgi:hypothetical protein